MTTTMQGHASVNSGPIRSLKRTFTTSSTASTSIGHNAAVSTEHRGGLPSKILKKLDKSAFVCDLDEDDSFCNDSFDWSDFDASVASNINYNATSASATSVVSGASSISSKSISIATTIISSTTPSTSMNAPPPRGPVPRPCVQMQTAASMLRHPSPVRPKSTSPSASNSFPPASQYLPVPTTLPRLNDALGKPPAKSASAAFIKVEQNENIFFNATRPTMSLPEGALRNPFGKKDARKIHGQTSLDVFTKKDGKSRQDSTQALTTDANKRILPWDATELSRNAKQAKLEADSDAVTITTSSKGKGKQKLVNIKQQIVLSTEQTKVLRMVVDEGKNVFFTGSAGTGKSILLREIIASLRRKYANRGADRVAITASTGIAAANIGGTTIHSFAGIGLGNGTGEQLIENVKKNRKASGRWMRTEVLIIDEVSMMDGDLFDKLCHIATRFRRKEGKPFGGIQLIITGDFFQLPPVDKSNRAKFAFEAASWQTCIDVTINLTKVFRQKDTEFVDMLNEMRFGQLSQSSIAKFHKLKRQPKYADGLEPTELFPTREQVDASNKSRLASLPGEAYVYTAHDQGEEPHDKMLRTLDSVMAPASLTLKVNAQVMSIKNHGDSGIVNGTIGRVVKFLGASEIDIEDTEFGSQDGAYFADAVDAAFDPIAKRNEVKHENLRDLAANDKIVGWKSKKVHEEEKVPLVEWQLQGGSTMRMKMKREEFKVEDVGDKIKAKRTQFPLILAYAMSIHKSQGQTLDRVRCDLGRIFEKGQAYVALSRCTSLDGLQILKFDANKVLAHPKVVAWTKTLLTLQ